MIFLVAKYFHILSVLGLIGGLTMEVLLSKGLHSSSSKDELQLALGQYRMVKWVALPSYLTILITGMYLASERGGPGSWWIAVSLGSFLLMAITGGVLTGRAFAKSEKILNGKTSDAFSEAKRTLQGFDVKVSLRMRLLLLPAILALMVFQPRLEISITLVFVCLGLGLLSAFSSGQRPLHFKTVSGLRQTRHGHAVKIAKESDFGGFETEKY